jgi:5'-3' exonuclease
MRIFYGIIVRLQQREEAMSDMFDPDPSKPSNEGPNKPYKWLVVDGGGLATTAWSTHKDLESRELRIKATVYVFTTTLASLSRLIEVGGRIVVAWDGYDNRRWRRGLHPWYKHGRGSIVNRIEVREAMGLIDKLLDVIGAAVTSVDGREADDVVASICTKIAEDGEGPSLIFSDDKDYIQMISDDIHLCRRSLQGIVLTPNQCQIMGIPYGIDYLHQKAMMGDSGDNIRGLSGIGEAKAIALVNAVPDAMDLARSDPDLVDWRAVPDAVRNAFVRAGRKLLPTPDCDREFADEFSKRRGTSRASDYDVEERDCLTAAMVEAVRCLDLVELDTDMIVNLEFSEPNVERLPSVVEEIGLKDEHDLMSSLYRLAGHASARSNPTRTSALRAGDSVEF